MTVGRSRAALTAGWTLLSVLVSAALLPASAPAHGLVGRSDLPLPDWLFAWGSSIVLIVSFVALTLGWRAVRFEDYAWRPLGERLGNAVAGRPARIAAGAIGVLLLALVVWTGIEGVDAPDRNFSVTFVFVTFWLGTVVLSVLFGDVFRAFNPWRAIAHAAAAGFGRIVGRRQTAPFAYPEWLGRWPAVAGLVGFVFLELVWGQTGFAAAGLTPQTLAVATVVYSLYTFVAMTLFGIERWTDRGETFTQYFGMFASLAVFEVRDGRLGRRPALAGATRWAIPAGSLALVLVAIGATTFDGAQEGVLKDPISSLFQSLGDSGLAPTTALRLTNTLFLAGTLLAVAAIFWAGIYGMRMVDGKRSALDLARRFAHAFIPIALAYLVAHYFSLVVYQEQAQFTFLLSDPFGDGSNLFGTAGSGIDYGLVGANAIWYVQFGAIVVGHVIALALGHDRALALWGDSRTASYSQVWMLVTMVFFSVLGLYLLSQANA
ncbi:MAG TPA: fenitrothion hydrolase [Solirubrobacterales bacterium]|nr:fenitrothion hydrolase [Solirubrobacterales bacterium]